MISNKFALPLLLGLEALLANQNVLAPKDLLIDPEILLCSYLSRTNKEGVSYPPTQFVERSLRCEPVCTFCTWYGALWWPFLREAYLAPQTSIDPTSLPVEGVLPGKGTLKSKREGRKQVIMRVKQTDQMGKMVTQQGPKREIISAINFPSSISLKKTKSNGKHILNQGLANTTCRSHLDPLLGFVQPKN